MVKNIILKFMILFLSLTATAQAGEVMVFAAASLRDSLSVIAEKYQESSKSQVRFNWGGSRTLRLQIENGLPCDLFVAADEESVRKLVQQGLVKADTVTPLLKNHLVIIAQRSYDENINSLFDLNFEKRDVLAIADPQTAPAGVYAIEALKKAGLYDKYKPYIVPCLDVRAAMALVESRNAKYAIVYATDVRVAQGVKMIYQIPGSLYQQIVYTASVVKSSPHIDNAMSFLHYLGSEPAKNIFKQYGFDLY